MVFYFSVIVNRCIEVYHFLMLSFLLISIIFFIVSTQPPKVRCAYMFDLYHLFFNTHQGSHFVIHTCNNNNITYGLFYSSWIPRIASLPFFFSDTHWNVVCTIP
jgi:hypothetical protein